jgi:hypothetical protein
MEEGRGQWRRPRAVRGDDEAGRWSNAGGGGVIELGFHGLGRGNSNELL